MIEADAVSRDELLARFVLFGKWIRADQTIRPEAFIPHPYTDLSVTRHKSLLEENIWVIGQEVADKRGLTLYGRGDIYAVAILKQNLNVQPAPVDNNPNHANIVGWPEEKSAQKIIAMKLAALATFQTK